MTTKEQLVELLEKRLEFQRQQKEYWRNYLDACEVSGRDLQVGVWILEYEKTEQEILGELEEIEEFF